MRIENPNFPGLCHRFTVDINLGGTSSVSTEDELDADTLTSMYDMRDIPLELLKSHTAFCREKDKARIESASALGISKLAEKLINRGLEVKGVSR